MSVTVVCQKPTAINVCAFQFQSPLFSFWLPADNIIGLSGGPLTSRSVADGFFIMLKPPSVGSHTLHFRGGITGVFVVDVTYHLNIVRD